MADRREIERLKNSRSGYKATVTRISNRVTAQINNADPRDEAPLIQAEFEIKKWEEAVDRYVAAEDAVMSAAKVDPNDADADLSTAEDRLARYKAIVVGRRKELDKAEAEEARAAAQAAAQANRGNQGRPAQGGGQAAANAQGPNLPKLVIDLPPILEEDTDLITWLRWKPTWTNYAGLLKLEERDQRTQVSVFWQSCSPGFQKIVNHTLGIGQDTRRPLQEVLDAITTHLRSLRNRQLDLREYLSIKQRGGQDYVSLCNEILELGEYANTGTLTAAQLHIGVLILAMRSEQDRAKLINENPDRFEDARAFILNLETARKASQQITQESKDTSRVNANKLTKYQKDKWSPESKKQESHKKQATNKRPESTAGTCWHCDKGPEEHGVRKSRWTGKIITDWCRTTEDDPVKSKTTNVASINANYPKVVIGASQKKCQELRPDAATEEPQETPPTEKPRADTTDRPEPRRGARIRIV